LTGSAFDPGPAVPYQWAGDWLEAYQAAFETGNGDAFTGLFSDDAEFVLDPFEPPLVGSNAIRAYLLDASGSQTQTDLTIERHWVSGPTILAAWHASYVRTSDRAHLREAGFLTAEIRAERCIRLRRWAVRPSGAEA
jgi:ketosteroid isomerase-like protein